MELFKKLYGKHASLREKKRLHFFLLLLTLKEGPVNMLISNGTQMSVAIIGGPTYAKDVLRGIGTHLLQVPWARPPPKSFEY